MTSEKTYNDMILAGVIQLLGRWMEHADAALKNPDMILHGAPQAARTFYHALQDMADPVEPEKPTTEKATPKQIKDSVKPDGLVSFEDGKTYKSLKRHLTRRGLTPDEYRAKWGLPADYAMVSAEYSERRSELAKANGLGRK